MRSVTCYSPRLQPRLQPSNDNNNMGFLLFLYVQLSLAVWCGAQDTEVINGTIYVNNEFTLYINGERELRKIPFWATMPTTCPSRWRRARTLRLQSTPGTGPTIKDWSSKAGAWEVGGSERYSATEW